MQVQRIPRFRQYRIGLHYIATRLILFTVLLKSSIKPYIWQDHYSITNLWIFTRFFLRGDLKIHGTRTWDSRQTRLFGWSRPGWPRPSVSPCSDEPIQLSCNNIRYQNKELCFKSKMFSMLTPLISASTFSRVQKPDTDPNS